MTEAQIRSYIKAQVPRFVHHPTARLVEEMEICAGRARADLAVICDRLIGIEIKGPRDNVNRLALQVPQYSRCFDQVILVVHEALAKKAFPLIPQWWGVVVADEKNGSASYEFKRRAAFNRSVDVESVLSLLWRQEVEDLFLRFFDLEPPNRASKRKLREQLLTGNSPSALKSAGIDKLRQRQDWRSAPIADAPFSDEVLRLG